MRIKADPNKATGLIWTMQFFGEYHEFPFKFTNFTRYRLGEEISEHRNNFKERGGMPVNRVSIMQFIILRKTLRNHIRTGSKNSKMGRFTILTKRRENGLCCRIMRLAGESECLSLQKFC